MTVVKSMTERWRRAPGVVSWTFAWKSEPPRWLPLMVSAMVVSGLALTVACVVRLDLPQMRQADLPAAEIISVSPDGAKDAWVRAVAEAGPMPLRLPESVLQSRGADAPFQPPNLAYRYEPGFERIGQSASPLATESMMVLPALPEVVRSERVTAAALVPRVEVLDAQGWASPRDWPLYHPAGVATGENRKYLLHLAANGAVLQCVGLGAEGKRRDVMLETWLGQLNFVPLTAKSGWVAIQVRWEARGP